MSHDLEPDSRDSGGDRGMPEHISDILSVFYASLGKEMSPYLRGAFERRSRQTQDNQEEQT